MTSKQELKGRCSLDAGFETLFQRAFPIFFGQKLSLYLGVLGSIDSQLP
jgi:hypothetical protein